MLILTGTSENIQVILAGAITTNQLNCFASYRDTTSTTIVAGKNYLNTNNTTAVNIVGSPAASTQRVIDYMSIYNTDTVNSTVTVRFNDATNNYILFKTTLASGEKLEYQSGIGFKVLTTAGSVKTSVNQGSNTISTGVSKVILASDVINADAVANSIADVTGLSFPVNSGQRYWFRFVINYTCAISTTGSRWSINGTSFSELTYYSVYPTAITAQTLNHGVDAYDIPAASNASSPNTNKGTATIEGFIVPSSNGTVIARFASEIAGSAITAKAGSLVEYQAI